MDGQGHGTMLSLYGWHGVLCTVLCASRQVNAVMGNEMEIEISHNLHGDRGRYWAQIAPGYEAEMTYHYRGPDVIVIDHTYVPPAYEGQGVGLELVRRGVADARGKGLKIVPQCPFVAALFRRYEEWKDVLAA
ncbi:hypothetical protein GCM10011499_31210 [Pelagibacterium lentulum]|uniref:N-acetyltransferase domain-containing protein n=2 Tax=Pelagibacterium lentulum TaxID=2029865 RepID=A0A916RJX8_9HYPH|nr:hypothetical protein GCM10011499_31210 [Pelagibacterium lentulum]